MAQIRNKGQAGMGGRGKNLARYREDVGTPKRERNLRGAHEKGGGTLSRPANEPRKDTKRNQDQWHQQERQRSRY
jgi:hypothetical protein